VDPERRFETAAPTYAATRPAYPPEVADWIRTNAGLQAGDPVLDLGAGTGALTERLLEVGFDIQAAEPSAAMRKQLVERFPQVDVVSDTAERLSAGDGTFALVCAANAFHWFDPDRAFPEIHRVLTPGGTLAVVWNLPDESDLLQARFGGLARELLEEVDCPGALPGGPPRWEGFFAEAERATFSHSHRLRAGGLIDYVSSWSTVTNMDEPDRRRVLETVAQWETGEDVEMPFEVQVNLGTRASQASRRSSSQ